MGNLYLPSMIRCCLILTCVALLLMVTISAYCQCKTDNLLRNILTRTGGDLVKKVVKDPVSYRYQIIYTQINRDKRNQPVFKKFYLNVDPALYFNPASTVKLPLAILALEKINKLKIPGINKYTSIQFDSSYPGQRTAYKDSTSINGFPSIAHYVKKAFLISDNDAYNRFYQFLGQGAVNRTLLAKGYNDIRITRQFQGFNEDQNRHTNQLRFIDEKGRILYRQLPAYNTDSFDFRQEVKLGKAYHNRDDSLINAPMDFTRHNNISLEDLQQILQSVLFPASVPARQRFDLSDDDHAFLLRYLSQFPSETNYPNYDTSKFYDSYVKFFMRDSSSHQMPNQVRVFNKVGWSYGFLTDLSYIADFKNRVEFMLSATVYVNSDGVLNDDKYDYDSIGYPFLFNLGQTIYQYELKRKRMYKPNLSGFNVNYERRDPLDMRPMVREVEN